MSKSKVKSTEPTSLPSSAEVQGGLIIHSKASHTVISDIEARVSNEHNGLEPSFCEIKRIFFCAEEDCYFVVNNWEIIGFNSHVHAYHIEPTQKRQIVSTATINQYGPIERLMFVGHGKYYLIYFN